MGWPSDEKQPIWDNLGPDVVHIMDSPEPLLGALTDDNNTDFKQLAENFVKKQNRILLKRDQSTTNHPCPDDLAVGELVLNAVTGNLYTKLVTGRIVMYKPNAVCDLANQMSLEYSAALVVPETCDSVCSVSGNGISFTSGPRNTLRFNPVEMNEGLPITVNIRYISNTGEDKLVGRLSIISDYKNDMSFELLYYPNNNPNNFYPLSAKFGPGIYPNGTLGSIKIEMI